MENNKNEHMDEDVTIEIVTNSDLIFQQDKALVDVQVATAKQYPRDITRLIKNIEALVSMDEETAQTCAYALTRSGKTVTGPSVHLAKIIMQNYGNMRADAKVVAIEENFVRSQAVAWDIENNIAIKIEVLRKITDKKGNRYSEDMIVMTGNAANSIAFRNAVLAVVPTSITRKALYAAKEKITGDISDKTKLTARAVKMIDHFKSAHAVSEGEILKFLQHLNIDEITGDDIVKMIGINQAILDGDTTVEQTFRPVGNKPIVTPQMKNNPETQNQAETITAEAIGIKVKTMFDGQERTVDLINSYKTWLKNASKVAVFTDVYAEYKTQAGIASKELKTLGDFLNTAEIDKIVEFTLKVFKL